MMVNQSAKLLIKTKAKVMPRENSVYGSQLTFYIHDSQLTSHHTF